MSMFPGSPRLLRGGIVEIDPDTGAVQNIVVLQYNPETLSRTLQVQTVKPEHENRSEALRLTGPPIETFKLDAEIDATEADYIALGHWNRAAQVGTGKVPAYYSGSPDLEHTINVIRLDGDGVEVTRQPLALD